MCRKEERDFVWGPACPGKTACQRARGNNGSRDEVRTYRTRVCFQGLQLDRLAILLLSLGHVDRYYMLYINWFSYNPNMSPIVQYCYYFIIIVVVNRIIVVLIHSIQSLSVLNNTFK